jgi:hypothetical protein
LWRLRDDACTERRNGLLVRRVAELHPEGEQWDVSRALGDVALALAEIEGRPEKDFGQRVRSHRQELGLPVVTVGKVLPLRASQLPLEPPEVLAALDAEPPETKQDRATWRARLAERRMGEAHLALEEAEQRAASVRELERVAATFDRAVKVYEAAALVACAAPAGGSVQAASGQGEAVGGDCPPA